MKAIKITILLLFLTGTIYAQNCCESGGCYIRLDDISGVDTDTFQNSLQAAACRLVKAFPEDFRRDFRVYDFGFYLHNEHFDGSYPAVFEQVKSQIDKPYYLLFGKQTDSTGVYSRIWVEVKLPTTGSLACVKESHMNYFSTLIQSVVNQEYVILGKVPNNYSSAEKKGMSYLKDLVLEKYECCKQTLRNGESCGECLTAQNMLTYLKNLDYSICDNYDITAAKILDTSSYLKQYANITISSGNKTMNINNEIAEIFDGLSGDVDVSGEIRYYFDTPECNEIMKMASKHKFKGKKTPYLYIKVIAFNSFFTGNQLAIKVETNILTQVVPGTGTLYILNFDKNTNTNAVIDSTQYFFDLAQLSAIKLKKIYKTLTLNMGKSDAIAIIGKSKLQVVNFILNDHSSICDLLNEYNSYWSVYYWAYNENGEVMVRSMNPEKSTNPVIMVDVSDLSTLYTNWDNKDHLNRLTINGIKNKNRLIAFLILHGTSHLAGFAHSVGDIEEIGYWSDGDIITIYLKNN